MERSPIPPGIWDIISGEAAITVGLTMIVITILIRVLRKECFNIQDIITFAICGFVILNTFGSLYAHYGWTWIQQGQWAGLLFGLMFFGILAWIAKKMVEKTGE